MLAPGLKKEKSCVASAAGTPSALPSEKTSAKPAVMNIRKAVAEQFERCGAPGLRAEIEELAGHRRQ